MVCRDCGAQLQDNARGCSRCAMNIDAEKMIDKFLLGRLVPAVAIVIVIVAVVIVYLRL